MVHIILYCILVHSVMEFILYIIHYYVVWFCDNKNNFCILLVCVTVVIIPSIYLSMHFRISIHTICIYIFMNCTIFSHSCGLKVSLRNGNSIEIKCISFSYMYMYACVYIIYICILVYWYIIYSIDKKNVHHRCL